MACPVSLQHACTFFFLTFYSFRLFYAFRYRMLSFADVSGRRTAVVALRNSLYLIPLGFIAYDCELHFPNCKGFFVGNFCCLSICST